MVSMLSNSLISTNRLLRLRWFIARLRLQLHRKCGFHVFTVLSILFCGRLKGNTFDSRVLPESHCCKILVSKLQGLCLKNSHFRTGCEHLQFPTILDFEMPWVSLSLCLCSIHICRLVCASWVFTIENSPLIIHPSVLYHSLFISLYLSPQCLSLNSPQ